MDVLFVMEIANANRTETNYTQCTSTKQYGTEIISEVSEHVIIMPPNFSPPKSAAETRKQTVV